MRNPRLSVRGELAEQVRGRQGKCSHLRCQHLSAHEWAFDLCIIFFFSLVRAPLKVVPTVTSSNLWWAASRLQQKSCSKTQRLLLEQWHRWSRCEVGWMVDCHSMGIGLGSQGWPPFWHISILSSLCCLPFLKKVLQRMLCFLLWHDTVQKDNAAPSLWIQPKLP